MIRDAMEYLVEKGRKSHEIVLVNGKSYSTEQWREVGPRKPPETVFVSSLSGFVDCLNLPDIGDDDRSWFVHVINPDIVILKNSYCETPARNDFPERDEMFVASHPEPKFRFGQWMPIEEFVIGLITDFERDDNLGKLYEHVRSIKGVDEVRSNDSGYSTDVTKKKGTMSQSESKHPDNPIGLKPYRTFIEVQQPVGHYHYRIRENGGELQAALFPLSGDMWKLAAMRSIKAWLEERIYGRFTVVA